MELPPDGDSDEITLRLFVCESCGLRAAGYYEESRRGSEERWHHRATPIDLASFDRFAAQMATCATPGDRRCLCRAHRELGHQTGGRWDGLTRANPSYVGDTFTIRSG